MKLYRCALAFLRVYLVDMVDFHGRSEFQGRLGFSYPIENLFLKFKRIFLKCKVLVILLHVLQTLNMRIRVQICHVVCQDFIYSKLRRTGAQDFKIIVYFTFVIHIAILENIHNEISFFR